MANEVFAIGTKDGNEIFGSVTSPSVVMREAFGPMSKDGFEIFSSAAPVITELSTVKAEYTITLPTRDKVKTLRR